MIVDIYLWQVWGAVFSCVIGTSFHFAYDWFGKKKPLALFFAVNESTWEHCKIAFWPACIYSIIEFFFIGSFEHNFFFTKSLMLILTLLIIVSVFYTYTGVIGRHIFIIDILLFYSAIIFSYYINFNILISPQLPYYINTIGLVSFMILIIAFSTLTFFPIPIPLFQDPITGSYGISRR